MPYRLLHLAELQGNGKPNPVPWTRSNTCSNLKSDPFGEDCTVDCFHWFHVDGISEFNFRLSAGIYEMREYTFFSTFEPFSISISTIVSINPQDEQL
jgi:hypothetical protein